MTKPKISVIPAFLDLYKPAPYKVYYGGRGSGKSYAIADYLLFAAVTDKHKILCAREHQNSIGESSHALLCQRIQELKLEKYFQVTDRYIRSVNGSEFIFFGLRYNVDSIKSIPGITKVWVEEAQKVGKHSWDVLIPTIRAEKSEIIISFNPEWEEDYTFAFFVTGANQLPKGSLVRHVNYTENPYFPEKLRLEMEACRNRSEDEYLHIWEGRPKQVVEGAVYANELRAAEKEQRITQVSYDSRYPVNTAWDLGSSDFTAIWFYQLVANEIRIIDYYENNGFLIDHYIQYIQSKPFIYATHYLPHDGDHENIRGKSISVQMRQKGLTVRTTPRPRVKATGIEACRQIFSRLIFDREATTQGRKRLASYAYVIKEDKNTRSLQPAHDDSSHAADALQTLALGLQEPKKDAKIVKPMNLGTRTSWMTL